MRSVGSGIIGSSQEESSREKVSWKEGKSYFLPSNGGKALGWSVNYENDENKTNNDPVELFMIKSTKECMTSGVTLTDSSWAIKILRILRNNSRLQIHEKDQDTTNKGGTLLSENDTHSLKKIIYEFASDENSS